MQWTRAKHSVLNNEERSDREAVQHKYGWSLESRHREKRTGESRSCILHSVTTTAEF